MRKRCTVVGQENNVQCYFPTLAADVRYKLFRSYCSSIYGCELWHFNDSDINNFCTAWRTGLRRVWDLPNTTHSDLQHLIGEDLPIYDELCRRSVLFIRKCFFHTSSLVQFVTNYGIFHARHKSLIGSNFHFCVSRFNFCSSLFFNGCMNVSNTIRQHYLIETVA